MVIQDVCLVYNLTTTFCKCGTPNLSLVELLNL